MSSKVSLDCDLPFDVADKLTPVVEARLGDKVSITHTHPISASKHFYLSAINSRRTDEGNRAIPVQGGNPPTTRMVRAARRGGEASRAGALGAKGNVRATESGRKTSVLGAIKELISGSGASEEARK